MTDNQSPFQSACLCFCGPVFRTTSSPSLPSFRDVCGAMAKFEADPSSVSLPDPVWVLEGGDAPSWSEFLETMKVRVGRGRKALAGGERAEGMMDASGAA